MDIAWRLLACLAFLAGCSAPGGPAPARRHDTAAVSGGGARRSQPDPPVRINRTLVYPVRWSRAEDLAATLEPILVARYGPGVRIVPQRESNRLLIYLPTHREQEAALRAPGGGAGRTATPPSSIPGRR